MSECLISRRGRSTPKYNIYCQPDEPTTKDGIWFKTNEEPINELYCTYQKNMNYKDQFIGTYDMIPSNIYRECVENASCVYNNKLYCFYPNGEYNPDLAGTQAIVYDFETSTWSYDWGLRVYDHTFKDYPTYLTSGILIGQYMYVFGGQFGRGAEGKVAIKYDMSTLNGVFITELPYEMISASLATDGENIFIYDRGTFCIYNIETDTYKKIDLYTYPMDGILQYESGWLYGISDSKTVKYNPSTNAYQVLSPVPYGSLCSILYNHKIYFFGQRKHFIYDIDSDSYTLLSDYRMPFTSFTSKVVPIQRGDKIWILGFCSQYILIFGLKDKVFSSSNRLSAIIVTPDNYNDRIANLDISNDNFSYYGLNLFNTFLSYQGNYLYPETYYGNGTVWTKLRDALS